jgi:hypothetical protein
MRERSVVRVSAMPSATHTGCHRPNPVRILFRQVCDYLWEDADDMQRAGYILELLLA